MDAITADVRWLGFEWGKREFFASDYFEQLYTWAVQLITAGKAYVCDLNEQQIREYRGTDVADKGPITVTPPGATARIATAPWRRTWTCSAACAPGSFPTGRARCGRRSTWRTPTCTCATR